jgi:hypothetical protein
MSFSVNLDEICKFQACADPETIKLDLVAMLFRIYLKIDDRKILPKENYIHARDAIFGLNQELFDEVHKERFIDSNYFKTHEPTGMSVKLFTKRLDEYHADLINEYVTILEKDLSIIPNRETNDDEIYQPASIEMMKYMHNFCKEFFIRMYPEISTSWRIIKQIQTTNPEKDTETCICM